MVDFKPITIAGREIPLQVILMVALLVVGIVFVSQTLLQSVSLQVLVVNQETKQPVVGLSVLANSQELVTNQEGVLTVNGFFRESITIRIQDEEFEPVNQTIILDPSVGRLKIELKEAVGDENVLVTFTNRNGLALPAGLAIQVKTVCTRSKETFEETVSNQKIVLVKPTGCGRLILSATAAGFEPVENVEIQRVRNILLTSLPVVPKIAGAIAVQVVDEDTKEPQSKGFTVYVRNQARELITKAVLSNSQVKIKDIQPGKYKVSATDANVYAASTPMDVEVKEGIVTPVTIKVSSKPKSVIHVRVLNEAQESIMGARIVVKSSDQKEIIAENYSTAAVQSIALADSGSFVLQVSAPLFAWKTIPIQVKPDENNHFTVVLESCSVEKKNCGNLHVKVVNDEGESLENARVSLFDSQTGGLAALEPQFTDVNGLTILKTIPSGSYYIRASIHDTWYVESDSFDFDASQDQEQRVVLSIGRQDLVVNVTDEEGNNLSDASVQVNVEGFSTCPLRESCVKSTNETGDTSFELSRMHRFSVNVTKDGFIPYQTITYFANQNRTIVLDTVLTSVSSVPVNQTTVKLVSVKDESGKNTRLLARGRTYRVLLEVQFTGRGNHAFFARAGNSAESSLDYLSIDRVNVVGHDAVQMGSRFNPPKSEIVDRDTEQGLELTKWAEVVWNQSEPLTSQVEVVIKVSDQALPNTDLPFYYRAQSENNGLVKRDPVDAVLGEMIQTESRDGLYATAYQELFKEGQSISDQTGLGYCDEDWCLVEKRVYINEESQLGFEPFLISPDLTNSIELTIVNNTPETINDLNFTVLNGSLQAQSGYRITKYMIQTDSGSYASNELGFVHPNLIVPFLESGEKAFIQVNFSTNKPFDSTIELQVREDNTLVFDHSTYFETNLAQFLKIENDPNELPLLKQTALSVQVLDQAGNPTPEAIVSLQINGFGSSFALTNLDGSATIPIPVLSTDSVITLKAQKPTYLGAEKKLYTTQRAVEVSPDPIVVKLDQLSNRDQNVQVTITNQSGLNFILTGAELTFPKKGILDELLLQQSLIEPIGTMTLLAGESKTIDLPFSLIDQVKFKSNKEIEAMLTLDVTDFNLRQTYRNQIETIVEINVGQSLTTEDCLEISDSNFMGTTVEGIAQKIITLTNKCYASGKAIPVQNLEARLNWNSEILGNVLVSIDRNDETIASEVLQPGYVVLQTQLKANESVDLRVTFVPLNGKIGKIAFFDVGFNAQVIQEGGRKEVGPDKLLQSKVFIANLEQCLRFTPDGFKGIEISPTNDRGTFEFSTKDCGPIPIDIRLCAEEGNENCSGGTEGGIELSKKEFLNLNQEEQKVEVSRFPEGDRIAQIPGQYGITIQVRTPNTDWKKIGEYPVLIHPLTEKLTENEPQYNYFFLDRYKIALTDENNTDSVRLFNTQLNESIEVEACLDDWQKATAQEDFMGALKSAAISATASKLLSGVVNGLYSASGTSILGAGSTGATAAERGLSGFKEGIGWISSGDLAKSIQAGDGTKYWTPANTPSGEPGGLGLSSGIANAGIGLGVGIVFSVLGTLAGNWTTEALGGGVYAQAAGLGVSTAINVVGMGVANLIIAGSFAIPILGLILAAVMLIVQLIILFATQPPDCIPITMNLTDYVINLSGSNDTNEGKLVPADAKDVFTDKGNIDSNWQLEITDIASYGAGSPYQEVGIQFRRTGKLEDQPTYTILTVQATEHIHGENNNHVAFESKADCKGEDDMGFNNVTCDETTVIRTEKFHLRVKTKEVLGQFIQPQAQEIACVSGSRIGTTGVGALPKVKLNWSWNENNGVQWYTCDAKNPNAVYCDATQFSIMIFKRIHELDRSLQNNNYLQGVCPREGAEQAEKTFATISMPFDANSELRPGDSNSDINSVFVSTQDVNTGTEQGLFIGIGQAGVSKLERKVINRKKVFQIVAVNQSLLPVTFSYLVDIQDPTFTSYGTCDFGPISLQPLESKTLDCNQSVELQPRFYIVRGKTTANPDNNGTIIDTALTMGFYEWASDPGYVSGENDCDIPKTTEKYLGKPGLTDFLKSVDYSGTEAAPTKGNVLELTHFDAYLQKDTFSPDFFYDFLKQYETNVLDAPEWFNGPKGLNNLIKKGTIIFSQKFTGDTRVTNPGKYRIEMNIRFGNSWEMRPDLNTRYPIVIVTYYPIEDITRDSPLYYTPLNGKVGLYEGKYFRSVYGTDFNNQSEPFSIQQGSDRMISYQSDANSGAVQKVNVAYERTFSALNAQSEKRGNLLEITRSADAGWNWKVSPSLATPMIMKVREPAIKNNARAYYQILEDQQVFNPNESLALWSGMGQCLDFSGESLASLMNSKPDRRISTELDRNLPVIPKGYAFDWEKVQYKGDVWMKTIFYTPLGHQYTLQALSNNIQFTAPTNQKSGQSVTMDGILGMTNNYAGLSIDQTPDSLQALFDLVEKGQVCITRTENGEEYWWNEEALYDQKGHGSSVNSIESGLVGGETCIG